MKIKDKKAYAVMLIHISGCPFFNLTIVTKNIFNIIQIFVFLPPPPPLIILNIT